jgi:hypothetical protein
VSTPSHAFNRSCANITLELLHSSILHISDMALSSVAHFSKETHSQEHCRLFQLPFELRSTIFELAYTTDTNEDDTIDLHNTDPPRKDLALACQATYSESWALFKKARQAYWRKEFTITIAGSVPKNTLDYCNVDLRGLACITKLRLVCIVSGTFPPAVFIVHMSAENFAWSARLAPQDFSMFGTRPAGELTDFYDQRCNRWLAFLCEHRGERDQQLTPYLLPFLVWAASRPLIFF